MLWQTDTNINHKMAVFITSAGLGVSMAWLWALTSGKHERFFFVRIWTSGLWFVTSRSSHFHLSLRQSVSPKSFWKEMGAGTQAYECLESMNPGLSSSARTTPAFPIFMPSEIPQFVWKSTERQAFFSYEILQRAPTDELLLEAFCLISPAGSLSLESINSCNLRFGLRIIVNGSKMHFSFFFTLVELEQFYCNEQFNFMRSVSFYGLKVCQGKTAVAEIWCFQHFTTTTTSPPTVSV